MDYKKFISNRSVRFAILRLLSFVPDAWMVGLQYWVKLKRWPHIKHPKRFTEKLQWYKLYHRDPVMGVCVDKNEVRRYVESKGLGHILNEQYGVYDRAEEIDFDALPARFVLKTTDGGGGDNVLVCKDKASLDIEATRTLLNSWLNKKDINAGREWAYTRMASSKIIVEKYLEDEKSENHGLTDYKFMCFNGEAQVVVLDVDRYTLHKRNFYDTNWNNLHVGSDAVPIDRQIEKPDKLDEMMTIAQKLSEDFPFVRVDLYEVGGKVIFGEMTFYPWSGYVQYTPDSFDFELGKSWKCE